MGTDNRQYYVVGGMIKYEDFYLDHNCNSVEGSKLYDKYLEDKSMSGYDNEIEEHKGLSCLIDGMNGEWIFLGKILDMSEIGDKLGKVIKVGIYNQEAFCMLKELIKDRWEHVDRKIWNFGEFVITHYF